MHLCAKCDEPLALTGQFGFTDQRSHSCPDLPILIQQFRVLSIIKIKKKKQHLISDYLSIILQ